MEVLFVLGYLIVGVAISFFWVGIIEFSDGNFAWVFLWPILGSIRIAMLISAKCSRRKQAH